MTRYRLARLAQADLESIWDYTEARWGLGQAEAHVRDLQQAIEATAANPRLGRACDEIRSGYFKRAVGSHLVFYRFADGRMDVIRILHQRMDLDRHL